MKPIRKELNGITFEWNPTLYGKGGWMSVGKTGKLSPARKVDAENLGNPTDDQLKSHNIEKPEPKQKDVTERIKDEIYIWKPEAMSGKGAWYVLGTRGGLVRTAGIAESKRLNNIMKNKEKNKKNKEKESKAEDQKSPETKTVSGNSDEPKKPQETEKKPKEVLKNTSKNRPDKSKKPQKTEKKPKEVFQNSSNDRSDEYRERDVEYYQASKVRNTGITSLIAKHLSSGEGFGKSIKSAVGDKFNARMIGIQEKFDIRKKFDSINIGKAIAGNIGAAIMGRVMGRSTKDINYFTGLRARQKNETATLQQNVEPTLQSATTSKDPMHSKVSDNSKTNVKKGDSLSDVLTKLYNLIKKISEDDIKRLELEKNFSREKDAEKIKFLENLAILLGKSGGKEESITAKKEEPITEPELNFGVIGDLIASLTEVVAGIISALGLKKLVPKLANLAKVATSGMKSSIAGILGKIASKALVIASPFAEAYFSAQENEEARNNPNHPRHKEVLASDAMRKTRAGRRASAQNAEADRIQSQSDANPETTESKVPPAKTETAQKIGDTAFKQGNREFTPKEATDYADAENRKGADDVASGKNTTITRADGTSETGDTSIKKDSGGNVIMDEDGSNPKTTATPVSNSSEQYKSPLNQKEEDAFNLYNEERDKLGKDPISIRHLEDPEFKKKWIDTVKNKGLLKEDSKTTQIQQSNAYGEKVQSSIGNFNEAQRNAITTPTVMNVNNSRVTGSTGAGQSNLTVFNEAKVRSDEPTLRTCQYQSLRLVH